MANRRIIFHWSDGTQSTDVLGYGFTITAAFRKYTCDESSTLMQKLKVFIPDRDGNYIFLRIHLKMNAYQTPQGMNVIGGQSVDDHLSHGNLRNRMEIVLNISDSLVDTDLRRTGICIEFE
ncbi:hypothetical protein ACJMK2_013783 [Sinanodonta woodiana]|uniref:Uncharacterized protein n=1 Tax=Sinanodonta woodiana TaxID=1069815 RepID=A0ABD3V1N0_SINWO